MTQPCKHTAAMCRL